MKQQEVLSSFTIASAVFYDDAPDAIDWLRDTIGFELKLRVDGEGRDVVHSELVLGSLVVMAVTAKRAPFQSPRSLGGANTQSLILYVSDVEAQYTRAKKCSAKITMEPETKDYGAGYGAARSFELEDPEGHRWWITQRISS